MEIKANYQDLTMDRKHFLEITMGTAAAVVVSSIPNITFANMRTFDVKQTTVQSCQATSQLAMAQNSELVRNAYSYIRKTVNEIRDIDLRNAVNGIINNPAPTFMKRYLDDQSKQVIWQRLVNANLLDHNVSFSSLFPPCANPSVRPQEFISAPGSGFSSHHSYPGGLSTHVATNLKITLSIYQTYSDIFAYNLDKNVIIAAQALHDLHKPWVLQWQDDASPLPELSIAGTGAHHIFGLAEVMYRDFPAEVIIAQACAHNHPGSPKEEADVVAWLKTASMIAGKDPVQNGYLASSGITLPIPHRQEGYIVHLGDHDWVLSVDAAQKIVSVLQNIARMEYGFSESDLKTKKFNSFRNYVGSQISLMKLHHLMSVSGEPAVTEAVRKVVSPD
ncbi:MAG: hypothetical protein H6Q74_1008 [Firmicutes bacterium]|nr:hypothetical protein [Bacillota bacterium]